VILWINGKRKILKRDDPGGRGWEIVREVTACPDCASLYDEVPGRAWAEPEALVT
jgi:hypothetical protein